MNTELHEAQTGVEVIDWRREQLLRSGFPLPVAARLACDQDFDLHALIELVEHGCSPELAERILAPLDVKADAA